MSGDIADSLRARHYTDSPPLRRNLLAGSLQLLFWLFSHPTAWRHYIHRLDPALSPGFCLAELTGRQWRRPEFWRLLFQLYLAWPLVD